MAGAMPFAAKAAPTLTLSLFGIWCPFASVLLTIPISFQRRFFDKHVNGARPTMATFGAVKRVDVRMLRQPASRIALQPSRRLTLLTAPMGDQNATPALGSSEFQEFEDRRSCFFDRLAMQVQFAFDLVFA